MLQDVAVPKFTHKLLVVLKSGDRKEIAKQFNKIVKEMVCDIAPRDGSGSKQYYRILEGKILTWYPEIDDPLIRNICRRRLKKKTDEPITIEELCEDELEENSLLHPKPGAEPTTVTVGRSLVRFICSQVIPVCGASLISVSVCRRR